jgi:hypothetical protein
LAEPLPWVGSGWGNGQRKLTWGKQLQLIGGSLPLPLFQNGACPFPCTPLLSVLMLVTPTPREIVPLLPRFRVVAVSMQRLQIGRARIASITTDVADLDPVVM